MVEIERMEKPRRPAVLPGTKKRCPILAEAVYLDTETSHNYNPDTGEGHTWIYQWLCNPMEVSRTEYWSG